MLREIMSFAKILRELISNAKRGKKQTMPKTVESVQTKASLCIKTYLKCVTVFRFPSKEPLLAGMIIYMQINSYWLQTLAMQRLTSEYGGYC